MKRIFSIVFALALVLSFSLVVATPVMAQSWLTGWSYRVEITIDSDKIDEALVDFPVLLYLSTSSGINPDDVSFVFDELGAEKLKLAVTTGDGITQCYVEVEKWDDANEQAWLWVKVPNIASDADTTLYLYYDHTRPDNTTYVGDTGSTAAKNVWDDNFVGVWHKDEDTTTHTKDSTQYENHGEFKGTLPTTVDGKIGKAQSYDGSSDWIDCGATTQSHQVAQVTFSAWIKSTATDVYGFVFSKSDGTNYYQTFYIPPGTKQLRTRVDVNSGSAIVNIDNADTKVMDGDWHLVTSVWDGDDLKTYLDGALEDTDSSQSGSTTVNGGDFAIGVRGYHDPVDMFWSGQMDELRVSTTVHSPAWIKATYHSGDDSLLSYGSEESATQCVTTATGTGTACFAATPGCIANLAAAAISPYPGVELPHGMFSFKVCCINPGQPVTLTITLPGPVPRGTKWWKFQGGMWHTLPIGSDNGDNIIAITLTDGVFPGDADGIAGQITDPGGPGYYYSPPPQIFCDLEISSTEGGLVTTPGEGAFNYECGTVVSLEASPDAGYHFVNWTGDVDTVEDVNAATTTITVNGDYSITANFETGEISTVGYTLTISSTMGGSVTTPGEGLFNYDAGTSVSLVASPANGYDFVNWTGDGITHPDFVATTITMNGDYSITANFGFEETTSTDSTEGSSGPLACFIATAAYGTPTAEQIDVLREFRDAVLLESTVGSQFVALYYRLSPPIADFIAGNELLRTLVREVLVDPVVWVVEATGAMWRTP